MKIYKFGNIPTGSIRGMQEMLQLVNDSTPKIIVLSAPTETTEHLTKIAAHLFSRDTERAHDEISKLEFRFIDFANELFNDESIKQQAVDSIIDRFRTLWNFTRQRFTSVDEKDILSQGEFISSMLSGLYLKERGINNLLLNSLDFMRLTPEREPDLEYISKKLHTSMEANKHINVFLTQGHLCRNAYGETCFLKPDGDNASATLIGAALRAEEIRLWIGGNGIHSCDPHFVKHPAMVTQLSFDEAERFAHCGGTGFDPCCIFPARENNIPIRLFCSMDPTEKGTLISHIQSGESIKTITARDGICYIRFQSNRTLRPYLFISKIFDVFAKYHTPLCLFTSSGSDVSVAINDKEHLPNILHELSRYATTVVKDRMCILSVIGNIQWQYTGLETRILNALTAIPIRMISYGSNNNDVSLVIKAENKKEALQLLNDTLFKPSATMVSHTCAPTLNRSKWNNTDKPSFLLKKS